MTNAPSTPLLRTLLLPVGTLFLVATASAIDASIYGAVKQLTGPPNSSYTYQSFSTSASTTLSDGFTYFLNPTGENPFDFSGSVYSAGDGGGAHMATTMRANRSVGIYPSSASFIQLSSTGQATVTFNDMMVTGNGNGAFSTRFNTVLDGTQQAGAALYTSAKPGEASAASDLAATMFANGFSAGTGYHQVAQDAGSDRTMIGSGLLQSYAGVGPIALKSDAFTVTPGKAFSVGLLLSTSATIGLVDEAGGSMVATTDFSNTFTFPTGVPVFDLPAGYTVNSPSAHIVNNFYVNPVPESGTFAALGLGVLGLLRRRRRTP